MMCLMMMERGPPLSSERMISMIKVQFVAGMREHDVGNVRVLNLALNNLSGALPVSIDQWTELEALTLFSNNLNGALPPCFGNFSRLQTLKFFQGLCPKALDFLRT